MVRRPSIIINRLDAERLQRLIDSATEKDLMVAQLLEEELARGEVLDPQDIPNDVVSMNSQVRFTDLTRGSQMVRTLVYPHSIGVVEDGISVMAPIGAALIGLRVGDVIEWPLPNNTKVNLRIDAIFWQPEREKQFHR
ncbi:MAG TPA: nucleoside diphosphate kinase regulator [Halomonas sp.]|jgi:regulator of nucleoside diphosphate kinase|uniref:nucleoside diphosphate kinase regulator n=1 Tax=Halomonadaceae TaxID=28256 RepID=UPI0005CC28A3|nr:MULTISPECIES: nucleoside diphosphate kinase regulator [Halomonas]MEE3268978.1 nucleoside diphosphate kinase regulator [Pseudomonadota bacterium]HAV44303.1 nucleoside diphosphate kinase regulator [Halomonas sp.]KJD19186.1 nucleoside diphosphate kinase regulator [Halomonas meridiana]MCC4289610.1 nucleoside diphosphate kinase regulator [Halomonas axialensis]MCF2914276.1 nucleoside diphosphate kinase regulator [Halomonas sp. Cn5-12]|tara:strand:+ start:218 stop:631 length:414 start_codon:yes stop_codon:yes gene_type:complete